MQCHRHTEGLTKVELKLAGFKDERFCVNFGCKTLLKIRWSLHYTWPES